MLYACSVQCDYSCRCSSNLRSHKKRHVAEKEFRCGQCTYRGRDAESLRVHLQIHAVREVDAAGIPTGPLPKLFKCRLCDHTSNDRSNIRVHERTHIPNGGGKPFKCPHCDYRSSQRVHMVLHVRRRHGEEAAAALPSPSGLRAVVHALPAPLVLPAHDDDGIDYDAVARAEAAVGVPVLFPLRSSGRFPL